MRNITKAKNPNTSKAQAPSDMGDQTFKTGVPELASNNMCQKSSGLPRSTVSKIGQMSKSGRLIRKATREVTQSAALPHSRSIVPITNAPPASPAKKKYRRMYHSQFGGATKCSFGIYPPPRPSPAGEEGDEGAPPREGEGDDGKVSPRRRNAIRPATPARMAVTAGGKEPGKLFGLGRAAGPCLGGGDAPGLFGRGE